MKLHYFYFVRPALLWEWLRSYFWFSFCAEVCEGFFSEWISLWIFDFLDFVLLWFEISSFIMLSLSKLFTYFSKILVFFFFIFFIHFIVEFVSLECLFSFLNEKFCFFERKKQRQCNKKNKAIQLRLLSIKEKPAKDLDKNIMYKLAK